jgi:glycosyltransferase involved in cell wall biosynthesis
VDVSIVLVTYNRARFVRRTLESIVDQTYRNFEVLICDDCSSDETRSICQEYVARDSRFSYWRNGRNVGMPENLNSGLRRARCEFIANLHDGDIYDPTLIEKWRAALIKHPSAGFVFNRYRHLSPEGGTWFISGPNPEFMSGNDFLAWCLADRELLCPVWGTVMARRSVYEDMGFFDPRYSFWSDIDMWFRIAEDYDVAHVPEALIDLPHRETMPHLFDKYKLGAYRNAFSIYWAAKKRRYSDRPIAAAVELCRQISGFGGALASKALARLRSEGRRIILNPQPQRA